MTTEAEAVDCRIPEDCAGQRLDLALTRLLPGFSRARLQRWLRQGDLRLDGRAARPRDRVWGGERVTGCFRADAPREALPQALPQALPLKVVHADEALIVVDKPPGMVVHPAAGNHDGTLLNALLYFAPELAALPRAGLVHRLDKDTSGLLVVARNLRAHGALVAQLQARTVGRTYDAVVDGVLAAGGSVDRPIGRHPVDRKRMAVVAGGRAAVTHYRVARRYRAHTRLRVSLETGRTHQIRVHMQSLNYPLVGDPVYRGRARLPAGLSARAAAVLRTFDRQALHAAELALDHPFSGRRQVWRAPPPQDMRRLLDVLAEDCDGEPG